jgi:N-acetylglucosaminyldiphosphoundecaprenol N-acetyl-beta-D-mannosaminyltransferase
MEAAVVRAGAAVRERRRCRIMVTNANKAWLASRDGKLRDALEQAELVIPEFATVWASRVLGVPGIEYVGGLRLMVRLLAEASAHGWSVYLLGARESVVRTLARRIEREYAGIRLVGVQHGYFRADEEQRVRDDLKLQQPDLLFVALGSPKQEHWIATLAEDGGPIVSLGVGGSFDVVAGIKRDAPAWARGNGLEWAYRLAQDPRNLWRRYLVTNPWFVMQVMRARMLDGSSARR